MAENGHVWVYGCGIARLSSAAMQLEGEESAKTEEMKAAGAEGALPFKALAKKYNATEAQSLLRWGVQKGFAVLPKTMDPERMCRNRDISTSPSMKAT